MWLVFLLAIATCTLSVFDDSCVLVDPPEMCNWIDYPVYNTGEQEIDLLRDDQALFDRFGNAACQWYAKLFLCSIRMPRCEHKSILNMGSPYKKPCKVTCDLFKETCAGPEVQPYLDQFDCTLYDGCHDFTIQFRE